ncbi:MAG: 50S ribosomal protein L15 [Candidatus Hydrogenedentota bacterium]|nr:MAG: 50S ribosomal protein L15 [Candidatus Hydrogenedentota bacterium]
MTIGDLAPAPGSRRPAKRVGRGPGSGTGKTSGRGEKGQKSRAGYSRSPLFEGGRMPMVRRIPKRGFRSLFRVSYKGVNIGLLEKRFDAGEVVEPKALLEKGLIDGRKPVKILGGGKLEKKLTVKAHAFSEAARKAIEAAGGTAEILP